MPASICGSLRVMVKAMGVNAYHLANSHGMPIPVIPEPETNFKEVFTLLPSTYKFLVESRIIEDVEYTGHFSYDGSKTQRIAKRSQPWSDLDEQSEICKIKVYKTFSKNV